MPDDNDDDVQKLFEMKRTMDFIIIMIVYEHDSIKNVDKNINFHTID